MKRTSFSPSPTKIEDLSEAELLSKIRKNLLIFGAISAVLIISIGFFGPKVGSLFFVFSKHKNDKAIGDIVPPAVPVFSQVPEASNKKELTFNGVTEPDAAVALFVNGPEVQKTTADSNGAFTFANITLIEGQNILFAKSRDNAGNESEKSRIYYITLDEKKPEIKIAEPANNSTVRNLNKRVLVKGSINEIAEVKVNGQNALVKSDNTFEIVLGVDSGDVEIKIQAVDAAGNKTERILNVKYEKSS